MLEIQEYWGVVLAVSLDTVNAFNSLLWGCLGDAMEYHRFPRYLRAILWDYLRDRKIIYRDRNGRIRERVVQRGVPQGSVLGPTLWSLAFDRVLRTPLPPDCYLMCYADDTLSVAGGGDWAEAAASANLAVAAVVSEIEGMGLGVARHKTEAMYFYKRSRGAPPPTEVMVSGTAVRVGPTMKYLGLTLDGHWEFGEHFRLLEPRVGRVAGALSGLLPYISMGPDARVRALYANTVLSVLFTEH